VHYDYTKSLGSCAKEVAMLTADLERTLAFGTDEQRKDLFELFSNKNPNINHGDFMWFISDVFAKAT